jgi:hypothetical protein
MEFGIGYRSNIFDEIYSKYGDVTHTIDIGFRMPIVKGLGLITDLTFFGEAALIGLDDQPGLYNPDNDTFRADGGKGKSEYEAAFPILGGLDLSLYHGLDKIVVEAEYESAPGKTKQLKDVQGSIFVKKALNDRFTINLGIQSENHTKDFSFAGRLQGRIN